MDRRRISQVGGPVLFAVVAVLWTWKPKHPLALHIGVDVIGVVMAVAWLLLLANWLRNTVGWLRWARSGGLRTLGANVTLRSTAPLLAALAAVVAFAFVIAFVISRIG